MEGEKKGKERRHTQRQTEKTHTLEKPLKTYWIQIIIRFVLDLKSVIHL